MRDTVIGLIALSVIIMSFMAYQSVTYIFEIPLSTRDIEKTCLSKGGIPLTKDWGESVTDCKVVK